MSRRAKHAAFSTPFGPRDQLVLGTASWLLALCGAWLLVTTVLDYYADRRAEEWPTVEGTVTSLSTRKVMVDRFLPFQTWFATGYEYYVDSVLRQGSRVVFGGVLPLEFEPGQLKTGSRVTVHYDPADPDQAVLYVGGGIGFLIYACVAIFFLAVSLVLRRHMAALAVIKRSRRRRAAT